MLVNYEFKDVIYKQPHWIFYFQEDEHLFFPNFPLAKYQKSPGRYPSIPWLPSETSDTHGHRYLVVFKSLVRLSHLHTPSCIPFACVCIGVCRCSHLCRPEVEIYLHLSFSTFELCFSFFFQKISTVLSNSFYFSFLLFHWEFNKI